MNKAERIFQMAQENADAYSIFDARRAGSGDQYTKEVVDQLKFLAVGQWGPAVVNQFLSKENPQSVDFWLEDEQAIIAVDFNRFSSSPLLEREAFKALLAKDAGKAVQHLILIGDPGSVRRHHVPTARAIMAWMERHHQIRVQIWELEEKGKFTGPATADRGGDV